MTHELHIETDVPKVRVTSEGQTVVDARELLASPKVQRFMAEFGPLVQKYIRAPLREKYDPCTSDLIAENDWLRRQVTPLRERVRELEERERFHEALIESLRMDVCEREA